MRRKPPQSDGRKNVQFNFETEREDDGRWIAEIPEVPGALAYGTSVEEAKAKAYALALYAIADDVERQDKEIPQTISVPRVSA
ncbi:MAG: type II toxin-antitoxin system HicB family antitoxin [Terriglobales bacterium]